MSVSSRKLDRLHATFDHDGIVANAGLIVAAMLMFIVPMFEDRVK